ncbi:GNAT family N-acetyltransferase [Gracilibacillus sp. Marseille-QA3620]
MQPEIKGEKTRHMTWYNKLKEYFPKEEMKSKEHFDALLNNKNKNYYIDEGKNHILLYAERDEFIFIDYLYVIGNVRGNGIGKKLLEQLKLKGKPIFLEVEPVNETEQDTERRLRFYKREGFQHASSVYYKKTSPATEEEVELEILYWSPDPALMEHDVLKGMQDVYRELHTYRDEELYGRSFEPTEQALKIHVDKADILEEIKS